MTAAAPRLAGFAVALAVLFGIGALAGGVFDPAPPNASPQRSAADRQAMAGMAQSDQHGAGDSAMQMGVRGLAVSAEGLRMVVETPVFEPGRTRELRFRVLDDRGRALRDYDVQHTKRMHLIVVRRDLSGFQHLHPRLAADGTWRVPLRLDAAGSYRVFADFSHDDTPVTLGSDLTVDGRFSARQLPAPRLETAAGDYQVRLVAPKAAAGRETELRFAVRRDGEPVQVEPYLGADGHLVALREGDLAFLHVHPTKSGDHRAITFEATLPTTGRYRLFLQFKVGSRVQTAAFTKTVSR